MERKLLTKRRKIVNIILAVLMLAACLGVRGCSTEEQSEPVIEYENVPEAYWDMFRGGSFGENNIWSTDDEQQGHLVKRHASNTEQD